MAQHSMLDEIEINLALFEVESACSRRTRARADLDQHRTTCEDCYGTDAGDWTEWCTNGAGKFWHRLHEAGWIVAWTAQVCENLGGDPLQIHKSVTAVRGC